MRRIVPCTCLLLLTMAGSCEWFNKRQPIQGEPVARVYDKYLYKHELKGLVGRGRSPEDSIRIISNYIDSWIRQQLILRVAKRNLPAPGPEIERKIRDYKTSLITFAYEQALIREKMDTNVSHEQILDYYETHKQNFELKSNILQLRYVKLKAGTPNIDSASRWIRSDKPEVKERLLDYCFKFAMHFMLDETQWYDLNDILNDLPEEVDDQRAFLAYNRFFAFKDTAHHHIGYMLDYKLKGNDAPLTYVSNDIRQIILNKRKTELIENLYRNMYLEAKSNNRFETYF